MGDGSGHNRRKVLRPAVTPLERRVLCAAGDRDTTFGGGDGRAENAGVGLTCA